jgi:hypothetical protein
VFINQRADILSGRGIVCVQLRRQIPGSVRQLKALGQIKSRTSLWVICPDIRVPQLPSTRDTVGRHALCSCEQHMKVRRPTGAAFTHPEAADCLLRNSFESADRLREFSREPVCCRRPSRERAEMCPIEALQECGICLSQGSLPRHCRGREPEARESCCFRLAVHLLHQPVSEILCGERLNGWTTRIKSIGVCQPLNSDKSECAISCF